MDEKNFRQILVTYLKPIVKGYEIKDEVPVPYRHIYVIDGQKTTLEIWCFKQDIAIYKTLFDKSVSYEGAKIIANDKSEIQIKLKKDTKQKTKDVGLPFVIIETKKEQPNVHEVLAYSQKAQMIKTIFPYCKYVFCIYGEVAPRTYRHGIAFDKITSITNTKKNSTEMQKFKNEITGLIREAEKDLKNISKSGARTKE
jgi:hypothetical protein